MSETKQTQGREEEAAAALPHTTFSRGSAAFLVAGFFISILATPLAQVFVKPATHKTSPNPFPMSATHLPEPDELRTFEKGLEDNSVVLQVLRPKVQSALAGWLQVGNSEVLIGDDGWLFYRQGVDYVTGEGFLEPAALQERRAVKTDQPDPIVGILAFKKQLARRGIKLMVMPVPDKATLYPEKLWAGHMPSSEAPQNASFDRFVHILEADGVPVYDPTQILLDAKLRKGPDGHLGAAGYFRTDSHWTPASGELVAGELAAKLSSAFKLQQLPPLHLQRIKGSQAGGTDLLRLLGLPPNQDIIPVQSRPAKQVSYPGGRPLGIDSHADILLLGDSFSGIYTEASAGLAQHLAYSLNRPVDVISIPNGGSWAARFELNDELRAGHDRLADKKVVIYEFVARDLAFGDWKIEEMPDPRKAAKPQPHKPAVRPARKKPVLRKRPVAIATRPPAPPRPRWTPAPAPERQEERPTWMKRYPANPWRATKPRRAENPWRKKRPTEYAPKPEPPVRDLANESAPEASPTSASPSRRTTVTITSAPTAAPRRESAPRPAATARQKSRPAALATRRPTARATKPAHIEHDAGTDEDKPDGSVMGDE